MGDSLERLAMDNTTKERTVLSLKNELGIPCSMAHFWWVSHRPSCRPWMNGLKGASLELGAEDSQLMWDSRCRELWPQTREVAAGGS
jgi:hypothetical protein